jgi:uncharacterized lipoprotein YddW (UPF0748 family)
LELHAWFNPFRAVNSKHVTVSPSHISRTHPEYTTKYGDKIWLDPAQPFVRERALAVIRDVIRRYDIDAVHLDDYFYPYPAKSGGTYQDFDDAKSWAAYQKSGGALPRPDWRRDQVNQFVRAVHALVRQEKSSCKFGISPFGIYRPGQPAQVKDSLDCYDQIFADTRLWLREGWLDYLAPQLYWESTSPQYGFAGLYQWWQTENVQHRHVWPGIALYRIKSEGRTAYDPLKQVAICRGGEDPIPDAGHLLFSMSTLVANDSNIDGLLKTKVYTKPALVPESPWLGEDASLLPQVSPVAAAPAKDSKSLQITWPAPADSSKVRWWLVQSRSGTTWQTLRPIASTSCRALVPGQPEQVAIRAIGRSGVLGPVQTISTAPVSEPVSVP